MKRTMKLSDIRIPGKFAAREPREDKIEARMKAILAAADPGRAFPKICVNQDGWLSDGYAAYQAAQRLGLDEIPVSSGRNNCLVVRGTHWPGGKEYAWELPGRVIKKLKAMDVEIGPGLRLAAMTSKGVKAIRVTAVERVSWPTDHKEIVGLWRRRGDPGAGARADNNNGDGEEVHDA